MREHIRYFLALLLTSVQAVPLAAGPEISRPLRLAVVEGEDAFNNISPKSKSGRNVAVEVTDERGNPMPGAKVTFQLPAIGPGGTYSDGSHSYTATTDARGRASTAGFIPNNVEGRFEIKIHAAAGERSGSVVIRQSNTLAGGFTSATTRNHKSRAAVIGIIIAAAAGGGIAVGLRGGSKSPSALPPTVGVSLGTITVGGPR